VRWAAAPEQRDHACPRKPAVADERQAARVSSAAAGAQVRFTVTVGSGHTAFSVRGGWFQRDQTRGRWQ
jgi:hypothetical protein